MTNKKHLLSNVDLSLQKTTLVDNGEYLEVDGLLLYPFKVEADMLGNPVEVTNQLIQSIHDNYNKKVTRSFNFMKKVHPALDLTVNQHETIDVLTEHARGLPSVIGSIVGQLWIKNINGDKYLFARLRIKDEYAKDKIRKKLWRYLSVGFDDKDDLFELSVVEDPAVEHAQMLLSKDNGSINNILLQKQNILTKQNDIKSLLSKKNDLQKQLDDNNIKIKQGDFHDRLKIMLSKHTDEYKIKPVEERLILEIAKDSKAQEECYYLLNQVLSIITPREFNRTVIKPQRILSNGVNNVSNKFQEKLKNAAAKVLGKSPEETDKLLSNNQTVNTGTTFLKKNDMPPIDNDLDDDDKDSEDTKLAKAALNCLKDGKHDEAKAMLEKRFAKSADDTADPEHNDRRLSSYIDENAKEMKELREQNALLSKQIADVVTLLSKNQEDLVAAITPELVKSVKEQLTTNEQGE